MQFFATVAKKPMNKFPNQCLSLCIKPPMFMLQVQNFQARAKHVQSHSQAGGYRLKQKMKPGDRLRNEQQHMWLLPQNTHQWKCLLSHPEHTKQKTAPECVHWGADVSSSIPLYLRDPSLQHWQKLTVSNPIQPFSWLRMPFSRTKPPNMRTPTQLKTIDTPWCLPGVGVDHTAHRNQQPAVGACLMLCYNHHTLLPFIVRLWKELACFILASSRLVCSSFLRSFLFPTKMIGTLGQKCFTSGVHFSGMFSEKNK